MKIKIRSHWTLFVILLTSAVICKQRLLHGNEIMQYLQNCKCYNVDEEHSKKSLQSSVGLMKRSYLWTTRTILKGRSILGYFSRLNCRNFCLILTKVAKLYFLETSLKCLKIFQKWYPYNYPVRNNGPFLTFQRPFSRV